MRRAKTKNGRDLRNTTGVSALLRHADVFWTARF